MGGCLKSLVESPLKSAKQFYAGKKEVKQPSGLCSVKSLCSLEPVNIEIPCICLVHGKCQNTPNNMELNLEFENFFFTTPLICSSI